MKNRGITYLELVVVVGILGILLAVAGFGSNVFSTIKDQRALDQDIRVIHKSLVEARNQTILDGRKRQVLVSGSCMYLQTVTPSGTTTEKIPYHENLRLVTNTYSSKKLIFYPEGTVSSGGSITFQNKSGTKKTIVVQIGSGRIYWKEG
ncbi:type II secretion system protein [Alkalibacter rhizosphaerae]|uniref:Type II secretion system protein n=1 Tax=Alkalibacter rhizosphaerae TaxID=2815577 RepID=A0A975AIL3_9FIRM|nr:type II secretion system protein [Alkalibacter rhizosphaerae]QSX08650.1 type II secretion system protein [Alkalibacter rhizosphaerae]